MKKSVYIILLAAVLAFAVFLVARRTEIGVVRQTTETSSESMPVEAAPSTAPTAEPTPEPTPTPTPEPTEDPFTYEDSYSSIYSHTDHSSNERLENIKRAIEKIDGVKIEPGEVFSFNDTVGDTSDYNLAELYDNRYPEDEVFEIAGGVNQVASTLYCSAMYGCMTPVERYPHHFWITSGGYLKRGMDAYVCNNGTDETKDLKISNPFETPVMIKAYLDEDAEKIYVEFWGTNPDNWHAKPYFENFSLYLPGEYSYVCNRYQVKNYREVFKGDERVRIDDLNFDYDGDGTPDFDIYWWHNRDLVWEGGGHF